MKTKAQLITELYSRNSRGMCPIWLANMLKQIQNATV